MQQYLVARMCKKGKLGRPSPSFRETNFTETRRRPNLYVLEKEYDDFKI